MLRLPSALARWYRPATDHEVCLGSFGAVQEIRHSSATSWKQQLGTLDDERIFGPRLAMQCACGKYQGSKHRNTICDICGVKITSTDARRQRFGHIDLRVSVAHPLAENTASLSVIPVLPAAFIESNRGKPLSRLYENLIRAVASKSPERMRSEWECLIEMLLPVFTLAYEWNLSESGTIARGLALQLRTAGIDGRCEHCGYPLAGLNTMVCPSCGSSQSSDE